MAVDAADQTDRQTDRQTDDIYKDMGTDAADRYDFSEYPLDHPLYDGSNRKALGFFRDELNSVPMREIVGL